MLRFECGSWNSNLRWFLFKVCMKNFGHSNVKFVKLIFIENNSCEYTKCQFMKGHDRLVVKFVVKLIQQQVSISSIIELILWFFWIFRCFTKMNMSGKKKLDWPGAGATKIGPNHKKRCLIWKLDKYYLLKCSLVSYLNTS